MIPRFKPYLGWAEFKALFKGNRGAVERFEKAFAKEFRAAEAVAFPYGRSAQWAFFKALGIENQEIILPAYTCSVVAHAVSLSGNTPVFVDINLDDYNMDLDLLASAINKNTRAIIATHTFGYPQNLDRLEEIVAEAEQKYGHKVWLMQDCCHAFGAQWQGRDISSSGDVAVYAFNISKLMTSIFGGMLTFKDKELADRVRKWRDEHFKRPSITKNLLRRCYLVATYFAFNNTIYSCTKWIQDKTPILNRLTKAYHLDEKIHFPPDYLDLMADVEAAVGLEQLKKYPVIIRNRRLKASWYNENLAINKGWKLPNIVDGATYSHFVVRVPNKAEVVANAEKEGLNLGELIQYSLPELQPYKNDMFDCPNSILASNQTINLPLNMDLTQKDLDKISGCLKYEL